VKNATITICNTLATIVKNCNYELYIIMRTLSILYILVVSFLLNSCNEKIKNEKINSIKTFVFSNAGMSYDYSLKLNTSDTIFKETRFPFPEKSEYGIINKVDKDSLFEFLEKIDFSKYKHRYENQNSQHGQGYRYIIKRKNKVDSVYVYDHDAPEKFYVIGKKIKILMDKIKFKKLNTKIDFENLNYKMLPPPPTIEN
jgi:hypothetical protein